MRRMKPKNQKSIMTKNSQKGFVVPIIIAIGALLIAGGVYVAWQKNMMPVLNNNKVDNSSATTQTTAWKTYVNEKYGFSFKYPGSFALNSTEQKEGFYEYQLTKIAEVVSEEKYIDKAIFKVTADAGPYNVNSCLTKDYGSQAHTGTSTKNINGNSWYVFGEKGGDAAMGGQRGLSSQYRILHNSRCYIIQSYVYWHIVGYEGYMNTGKFDATPEESQGQRDVLERNNVALDNILSTFKFTDQAATSTSKIPYIESVKATIDDQNRVKFILKGQNLSDKYPVYIKVSPNAAANFFPIPGFSPVTISENGTQLEVNSVPAKEGHTYPVMIVSGEDDLIFNRTGPGTFKSNQVMVTVTK